ncbi:hypothetical protein C6I20_05180 [Aeromicrobium sp. A1-2]|uniref:hypothetical protein n=1 Tax=Aeromicrobium sp. A1-2 TaxID=2107713 RepID=UPI000E522100|nr:hypothetical protein [Aeromicrobium sp. A1-2]AXT84645.1 hypothetical protein C6I20_05180 [Aeromicrobium sp. A1-2]
MCQAVKCRQCGKTTWSGCGQHVDAVMAGVAKSDRCPGHTKAASQSESTSGGFLSRLRRR